MTTIKEVFKILVNSVPTMEAKTLADYIRSHKGINDGSNFSELPYNRSFADDNLPDFDNAYVFQFELDFKYMGKIDILEKDLKIIQVGLSIPIKESFLSSSSKKVINELKQLADDYFLDVQEMNHQGVKIINYGGGNNIAYLSSLKVNNVTTVRFNVGNRKFWDNEKELVNEIEDSNSVTSFYVINPQSLARLSLLAFSKHYPILLEIFDSDHGSYWTEIFTSILTGSVAYSLGHLDDDQKTLYVKNELEKLGKEYSNYFTLYLSYMGDVKQYSTISWSKQSATLLGNAISNKQEYSNEVKNFATDELFNALMTLYISLVVWGDDKLLSYNEYFSKRMNEINFDKSDNSKLIPYLYDTAETYNSIIIDKILNQ